MNSWAKTKGFGLEGCGRRMSDTWSSEIQKFIYGVLFQSLKFQKLGKLRNTKRIRLNVTFRPQIAASSIVGFVVWVAESAMVQIRWLGVWLLWALIRIPDAWRVLARICRAGFSNYAQIWELVSSSVQGGSVTLLLCGLLLVWISSALGYL